MTVRPRGKLYDWKPSRSRQGGILADLIARYQQHYDEDTLPRGGRGIFYDLRPNGMGNGVTYRKPDRDHPASSFGPMEASPEAVKEVLVLARRAGRISEDWVADTRVPRPIGLNAWQDADDYAHDALASFALDRQRGQSVYVEVLCEAEDLAPRLARIARPYGVWVYSGAGYDGLKAKRAFADRAAERDVPTVVLHVGDHDVHGGRIFTAAAEDAQRWLWDDYKVSVAWLDFRHLAVTRDQAKDNGILDDDDKAEADALPVPVLDRLLTDALDGLLSAEIREAVVAEQAKQLRGLPAAIERALAEQLREVADR